MIKPIFCWPDNWPSERTKGEAELFSAMSSAVDQYVRELHQAHYLWDLRDYWSEQEGNPQAIPELIPLARVIRCLHYLRRPPMNIPAIDGLLAQMRAAMVAAQGNTAPAASPAAGGGPDFASALKASLDQVAQVQNQAEGLEQRFTLGDPQVSLSDAMIGMQKANIALQTTVQVRNKVVAAYNDIMNMQV
jgi:flagellar hook-basal body complex protein FliE